MRREQEQDSADLILQGPFVVPSVWKRRSRGLLVSHCLYLRLLVEVYRVRERGRRALVIDQPPDVLLARGGEHRNHVVVGVFANVHEFLRKYNN